MEIIASVVINYILNRFVVLGVTLFSSVLSSIEMGAPSFCGDLQN